MERAFLHFKRVISKFWFVIIVFGVISPVVLFGLAILMTIVSMIFFDDPVDPEKAVEDMQDLKEKNNEMNEEFGEAINNAVDEDPDIEDELNRLEAEMNNYPNANKEQLVSSKVKTNERQDAKIPVGNLEFY